MLVVVVAVVAIVVVGLVAAMVLTSGGNSPFGSSKPKLSVTASASPTSGYADLAVAFTASAQGGSDTYSTYSWSFGNGGSGSGASTTYTYDTPGTYSAAVTVTDSSGATATSSVVGITVSPAQITITGFTFTPSYTGTTSGYLASSYTCVSGCPTTITGGADWTITMTLTSSAILFNHNINDFTVSSPFTFVSVSPSLPVTLSPGQSATFQVTVQAPSVTGSYSITGTISTN